MTITSTSLCRAGKVAVTVGPGVRVYVAPADEGARFDAAGGAEYRRDVDARRPQRRHKPGCPAARRDRAAAAPPRRPSAPPASSASAASAAPSRPSAAPTPTHRTAAAPPSPAPDARLDGLSPRDRMRVRTLAASGTMTIEDAIAIVRPGRVDASEGATLQRDELGQWHFATAPIAPASRATGARADAEQAGPASARARAVMIARNVAAGSRRRDA